MEIIFKCEIGEFVENKKDGNKIYKYKIIEKIGETLSSKVFHVEKVEDNKDNKEK